MNVLNLAEIPHRIFDRGFDPGPGRYAARVVGIAAVILACAWSYAYPHDHDRPELNGWFLGLQNKNKVPCCDGSEATRLSDVDWESKNGRYRVRLNGAWVDVPDDAVIEGPNRAGQTMVWPFYLNGELRGVRCFIPGSMI